MVKIIQNYTLHQQIGEGQYGKVYRGVDSKSGKEVAAKVINVKRFKENPKLEECTLNEIQVLNKIQSPYIVRFIQILKTINNFYFFYQYCNGGTLDQQIKRNGKLSQSKIWEFLQQLLQAFKILTENNIMHRDLKPTNILIHNGKIKIGDFGFCKSLQNQRDLAQTMLGSPIYMAPQVLKGQIYTIKADIWSLGVVAYQMAFGFCPFEQSSIARLINVLDNNSILFNRQINPISQNLEDFIRKCLVKDHFKRVSWDQLFEYQAMISKKNQKTQLQTMPVQRALSEYNRIQRKESQILYQKQNKPSAELKFFKKKPTKFDEEYLMQKLHQSIAEFIRTVDKLINEDIYPQITGTIALKCYKVAYQQHQKLSTKYMRQRIQLSQAIIQIQSLLEGQTKLNLQQVIKIIQKKDDTKCTDFLSKIFNNSNTFFTFDPLQSTTEKLFQQAGLLKSP